MSQENVETVRTSLRAWNRGDRDGWMAEAHPEVEWSSAIQREMEGAQTPLYHGRAGLARFWDEWHSLWDVDIELSEVRDLGDSVVALAVIRTTGKASGAEAERPIGYVFEFEDGLIRRARSYLSPEEALQAVGLRD